MKILFENKYTKDEPLLKEIYKYVCFKRPITFIPTIIMIGILIKAMIDWISINYCNSPILFISIFYFAFKIFYYKFLVSRQIKATNELNNGKPLEINTVVYNDSIQYTASNGAINEINFENIKYGFQTKNLILFLSKANLIYILKKDTFTKGTKDEFIEFIKNKGIKIH